MTTNTIKNTTCTKCGEHEICKRKGFKFLWMDFTKWLCIACQNKRKWFKDLNMHF